MSNQVLFERVDGAAHLTLNRPDKLNALTLEVFEELDAYLNEISQNPDEIGVVVLKGAGKCFSAGHDLDDIGGGESLSRLTEEAKIVERFANLPQPTIAAVHSHCYTGALELALGADIILASVSAKFADTHAKFGLTPFWGMSQRLPRRVGRSKANEISFTARTIKAEEALDIGLCNHVYADDAFQSEVDSFAKSILENSWFSLRSYKRLMNATDGSSLENGLAYEIYNNGGFGPDMNERVAKFLSK